MNTRVDDITGVVVSYNMKDLLDACLHSVREFYPRLKIIVIDGSQPDSECYLFVKSIGDDYTVPVALGYNIGHGEGMNRGIEMAETKYVLLFDTDIIMKRAPLERMLELFDDDTFGVGTIQYVNSDGINIPPDGPGAIAYLHPFFQIIDREKYHSCRPYAHHGAPCILTMLDIHERGISKTVLKPFPVEDYVHHDWRGTRQTNPKEFMKNWVPVGSSNGWTRLVRKLKSLIRS